MDRQEDLTFALWSPSTGSSRHTGLIHTPLLPCRGERLVHGNVSFQPEFLERACREAIQARSGIAFLHSHPFPGWQGMSPDDVVAEERMSGAVSALTGAPLIGMTVGSDGTWSARVWEHQVARQYSMRWCESVRVVGEQLAVSFEDNLVPQPRARDRFRRTVNVWGEEAHSTLGRLRVGIVGLGSVGALVVEALARMGLQRFVLIDFDRIEPHNLDRLVTASERDIGRLKVDAAADRIRLIGTGSDLHVRTVPFSVVEEEGYQAALDCDVLFSCVDRPRARYVLDHLSFNHLIPVIDGGIQVRFKAGSFSGVDWQVQTVAPGRACLECLRAYDLGDVSTEAAGKLDDSSYLAGLPKTHRFKQNENVFPFACNLASLETLHLIALVSSAAGIADFGVQRYRYVPGILDQTTTPNCRAGCARPDDVGLGDRDFSLVGRDISAEAQRRNWENMRVRKSHSYGVS